NERARFPLNIQKFILFLFVFYFFSSQVFASHNTQAIDHQEVIVSGKIYVAGDAVVTIVGDGLQANLIFVESALPKLKKATKGISKKKQINKEQNIAKSPKIQSPKSQYQFKNTESNLF